MTWDWSRKATWRYLFVEVSPAYWAIAISLLWTKTTRIFEVSIGPFHLGIDYQTKKLRRALRR